MGYSTLKAALDAVVKTNGRQQITGSNLNGVMTTILQGVDVMDRGNPADTSGMDKVVLDKSKTFAEQVTGANTIYEVRDSFSLAGSFSMPSGSVLNFNGGKIQGGTLVGNNTLVVGDYVFDNVTFSGTFRCDQVDIDSTHFLTSVDFFGIMKCFSESKLNLLMDITKTTKNVSLIPKLNLNGNGHTIKVVCLAFAQTANVKIQDCNFDCSIAESTLLHASNQEGGFLDLYGNGTNSIEVKNCTFDDIPGGFTFTYFRSVAKVDVSGCVFDGVVDPENVTDLGGRVIFLYGISESAIVDSCKITNCHGIAIGGINNSSESAVFVIRNNYIANITQGGVVFNGGIIQNVFVNGNVINDVNLAENESGAEHSAINFHGFKNIRIQDNTINALKATGIDIDGTQSGSTDIEKGENATFSFNKFVCRNVIFWGVKDIKVHDNLFDLEESFTMSGILDVRNNIIKGVHSSGNYPVMVIRPSSLTYLHDISFYNNDVIVKTQSTGKVWINAHSGQSGVCRIKGCRGILESNGNMAMYFSNGIFTFDDGFDIITKRINLSVASKEILIPRNRQGALMSALSYSVDGQFTLSASVALSFGLARPGVNPNDTQFGTITLSGSYTANNKDHTFTSRPNNTEQASIGDVYMVCPGGGDDKWVTLEFRYQYGYKPYY